MQHDPKRERDPERDPDRDDVALTLRVSRSAVATAIAVVAHVVVCVVVARLPDPKPLPKRIAITLQAPPPPPPPSMSPDPAPRPPPPGEKTKKSPPKQAPPETSPVAPELPPSEHPPENRAQLPVVETSPTPAPPPKTTWQERLAESLAPTAPKVPTGVLAPSFSTLNRVAQNDARLHDEETEARLQTDHGPFFRRGIEALRSNWHPDEVLRSAGRDPTKLCGKQTRTTYAVAVIDRAGNVVDIEVKKPSGCTPLDEEAVGAFLRVAQFPNPPAGLFVDNEGEPTKTARYPVRFIVSFDGRLQLDWG